MASDQRSGRGTPRGGRCATQLCWWRVVIPAESCNIDLSHRNENFKKKRGAGRSQHHYKHYEHTADMSATNGWLGNRSDKQTCPNGWLIVTNEHHWDMTFKGVP